MLQTCSEEVSGRKISGKTRLLKEENSRIADPAHDVNVSDIDTLVVCIEVNDSLKMCDVHHLSTEDELKNEFRLQLSK